jgi:GNAT superfamily N-acetyltransferase
VIRFPENPGYYFGNMLVFPRAPAAGDGARWLALFDRELGSRPEIRHVTIGWDGDIAGATEELTGRGLERVEDLVLSTGAARPAPRPLPSDLELRPVESHDDWDQVAALQATCDPLIEQSDAYARFRARNRARLRAMAELGLGRWLGVFTRAGELVGQMGIYADGELARFRDVETHPDYRRRGVSGALVAEALRLGLGELGARTVVVVANPGSDGERVYRAAGFADAGRQHAAYRGPAAE